MCVVSMIGEHYHDKWDKWILPPQTTTYPVPSVTTATLNFEMVSRKEFDDLKREVLELKELLKKAIQYDQDNNEPNCENEQKFATLQKVAELVGETLEDVLTPAK